MDDSPNIGLICLSTYILTTLIINPIHDRYPKRISVSHSWSTTMIVPDLITEQPDTCKVCVWSDGTWCYQWALEEYLPVHGNDWRPTIMSDDDEEAISACIEEHLHTIFP